jgi:hypothetical protein
MSRPRLLCALGLLSFAACGHAAPVGQLPPDLQHDPAARVMRLQQLRRPIVQRIKRLPEDHYRQVVRPALGGKLARMGFDEQDVAYFLTDLDRTRGR